MTLSTSKKVATSRAKPMIRKSSKTPKKIQQTTKNSQSHSQTSRWASVSNKEDNLEEPMHVGVVLNVDSDHTMEPSDGEEGMTHSTTSKNPTEISNESEDEEGKEDKEAEICKSLPKL
jgi:TATA-binding protein-associated factor Taf7